MQPVEAAQLPAKPPTPTGVPRAEAAAAPRRRISPAVLGFLTPNFLGFLAFTAFPVVFSLWMAFTDWSLKGQPAQFVGVRNFGDLLGVRPLGDADTQLQWLYMAGFAAVVAGVIGAMWANVSRWRGTRWGGLIFVGLGLAVIGCGAVGGGGQGTFIAAVIAIICGLAVAVREGDWRIGFGALPALLVAAGAAIIYATSAQMWQVHELRDERFWKYLYNTVYLMLGIPFAIVGSLSLAMLVNNRFGLSRKPRVLGAAMCLLGGGVTFWLLWTAATPHAPQWALYSNLALLGGVAWLVAALGIVFEVVSFRTLLYLPTFTSGVALMILWKALYNPQTGPINAGLSELCNGFIWLWNCLGHQAAYTQMSDMPQWLGKAAWAKPALIVMGVWTAIGGTNMLLYLSGLSNVPQELLDAAEVDGAGAWGRFRHVIWPQLAPTTFFITIMSIIGGFQGGFEAARVMTQGGPDGSTTTLSYYIYNKFWQDLELGYGAAISWVLFGIIFIATAINWKYGKELEVN